MAGNFTSKSFEGFGVYARNRGERGIGLYGEAEGERGIGVYGVSTHTGNDLTYGGYFNSRSIEGHTVHSLFEGTRGVAVYGESLAGGNFGGQFVSADSIGILGTSSGIHIIDAGVYGHGETTGVIGEAIGVGGSGVWGDGTLFDFVAGGPGVDWFSPSSQRWKENVVTIDQPIDKLIALRGVYFDWDEENGGRHDVGFIAEEIGEILPEIVVYEDNGIDARGMDYTRMTPLLVEAMKAMRDEYMLLVSSFQGELNKYKNTIKDYKNLLSQANDRVLDMEKRVNDLVKEN